MIGRRRTWDKAKICAWPRLSPGWLAKARTSFQSLRSWWSSWVYCCFSATSRSYSLHRSKNLCTRRAWEQIETVSLTYSIHFVRFQPLLDAVYSPCPRLRDILEEHCPTDNRHSCDSTGGTDENEIDWLLHYSNWWFDCPLRVLQMTHAKHFRQTWRWWFYLVELVDQGYHRRSVAAFDEKSHEFLMMKKKKSDE